MKGHLVKRIEPADWVVWYTDSTAKNGLRIIPLHPDDAAGLFIQDTDTIYDGIEVEFEIVEQFMPYDNFKPIHKFAKVTPSKDKSISSALVHKQKFRDEMEQTIKEIKTDFHNKNSKNKNESNTNI
jgi:hypothetical protein